MMCWNPSLLFVIRLVNFVSKTGPPEPIQHVSREVFHCQLRQSPRGNGMCKLQCLVVMMNHCSTRWLSMFFKVDSKFE
jgi:hypothetical protein